MAERVVPLLATQVARIRFPVPARPIRLGMSKVTIAYYGFVIPKNKCVYKKKGIVNTTI
jgi:hypothetical protein